MLEPYTYRPLSNPKCIRVFGLTPAVRKNTLLRGKLIELDLALDPPNRPIYKTLSYVWGSPKGDRPILCEGREILITKNCEAALRQFRRKTKTLWIWIDALCIDQAHVWERNHQVGMMDLVYRSSECVLIWLGSPYVPFSRIILRTKVRVERKKVKSEGRTNFNLRGNDECI
jgi:hypothetical protein